MIKYLKLLLFSFVFVLFGFINFSSAVGQQVGLDSTGSYYNDNYRITFLKGGGLLTNNLGVSKGVIALSGNVLFFWSQEGVPYFYSPSFQGYFSKIFTCNEISGGVLESSSCSSQPISNEILQAFFKNVNAGDWAYYTYASSAGGSSQGSYHNYEIRMCWSSHTIGQTLCFYHKDYYNSYGGSTYERTLTGSENYNNLFFSTIPYNIIGPAPGQSGYGQGIGNQSGDYVEQEVTDNDIVNYFENYYRFNRSMCYVSTTDLTSEYGTIRQTDGTGQTSIFDMFSHLYNRLPASDGYTIIGRWIDYWLFNYNYWFNYDNPPFLLTGSPLAELWSKTYTGFTSPFIGQPAFVYFYINELFHEGADLVIGSERYGPLIAEYCDLKLNGSTQYEQIETVNKTIKQDKDFHSMGWYEGDVGNVEYQNPTQGYNGGSSGFWDNNSYTGTQSVNGAFSQFYSNLSSLLSGISVSGNGIIPNYILFFLAFTILVRVLKK